MTTERNRKKEREREKKEKGEKKETKKEEERGKATRSVEEDCSFSWYKEMRERWVGGGEGGSLFKT